MYAEDVGSRMCPQHSAGGKRRSATYADVTAAFAPRIFLADADPATRAALVDFLSGKGFDVVAPADADGALALADVLIVALDASGQRTQRPKWLLQKPDVPTIVLDRSHVFVERAALLSFTPDARLSLPVHPRKLIATIRRILSLARVESVDPLAVPECVYNFSGRRLHPDRRLESFDGKTVVLEKRDFELLKVLLTFPRQLLTRQQLTDMVWGSAMAIKNRTLDRSITNLRRHLGDDVRFPERLKTVVGVGYRLDVDVEKW